MRSLIVLLALLGLVSAVAMMPKKEGVTPLCGMCLMLVQEVETDVANGESDIDRKAEANCDKWFKNGFLDAACKTLVDEEIDNIIKRVENKETPPVICGDLGLCKK